MALTRTNNEVFLIGLRALEPLLILKQLPTTRQVLRRFHLHLKNTSSVRNASHATIEEVLILWSKAAITTTLHSHAVEKLEKFHSTWQLLKKNKGRPSETQRGRELEFENELDKLFDIAHADALTMTKIKEDYDFLLDQRGNRKMFMAAEDKILAQKEERARQRRNKEEERRQKAIASTSTAASNVCFTEDETESSENSQSSGDEFEPAKLGTLERTSPVEKEQTKKFPTHQLFTSHVTDSLDRNKTSDREAVRLIAPIAAALGCDPASLPISRSSVRRFRKKARKEKAETLKREFVPEYPLVVHWDGKILPEIVGAGKVDRLPVLVSWDGHEKLLGVPKTTSGTGFNEATSVYNLLEQWDLIEKVQAMSFDTTSVNTGHTNGVCVYLENMIGRELLWLACRHHVIELILAKVFTLCCGCSSSPDVPIFKRFKAVWDRVKRENFQPLQLENETKDFVQSSIDFLKDSIERNSQPRDDYKELIELTMVVLGCPPTKIHWRAPGPVHHARWMAKLIYAIKIFLFREQRDVFKLTKREERQLERFVLFGALLYTKAWIEAPLATEAPRGDLNLWRALEKYECIDREISIAARKTFENHLWYLSDELVGLALFSENVTAEEKVNIVQNMTTNEPGERNVRGSVTIVNGEASLEDFATKRTAKLISSLQIGDSFLNLPPDKWDENEDYRQGRERVKKLRVVNDTAERGVKLFTDFNNLITNNEEDKQFLLQVVEANRKAVPTQTTKKSVVDSIAELE